MHGDAGYHPFSKALHWAIAGMIVVQFVLAKLADIADDSGSAVRELALLANHKSVGITILALVVVRVAWRIKSPPPESPAAMAEWQVQASRISHSLLYGLIILLPITGWLMSSASAYSVSWFNLVQLPDFIGPNPEAKDVFEEIHEFLTKVLVLVAAVHVLAALKHHLIDKDDVLRRMLSPLSIGLFVIVIALGGYGLGRAGSNVRASVSPSEQAEADPTTTAIADDLVVAHNIPRWSIDHDDSEIAFTGDQAGAEFDGIWQDWRADIRFDKNDLTNSYFDVTISTDAVETYDEDRDSALMDPEWFDASQFPEAHYRAAEFSANADGSFVAQGQLLVKGVAADVPLYFTVEGHDGQRLLVGNAEFLRLDLGIGTGEWEDTAWVGNEVTVNVRVAATIE